MQSAALVATLLIAPGIALPASYRPIAAGSIRSALPSDRRGGVDGPTAIAAFAMRETPVTEAEFAAFVRTHRDWRRDQVAPVFADASYLAHWAAADTPGLEPALSQRPVTAVSWFAAAAFCESEGGRLPTWLEWEYVAAADALKADARADPAWRARVLAWYAQPSNRPLPAVGGPPNFYGVRDLHGLVWEWVDDFNALIVSPDSRDQNDPDRLRFCGAAALSLADRDHYAVLMRIALLSSLKGADTTRNLGFRCVRESAP